MTGRTSEGFRRTGSREQQAEQLARAWADDPRWQGVTRGYSADDVVRLRGTARVQHSIADHGSRRLWERLHEARFISSLGAATGLQAVQQVKAGLEAVYVSGWQVAADANNSGHTYPDQSLYPSDSVPSLVRRVNAALARADQIQWSDTSIAERDRIDFHVPVIADAEGGFGGPLNAFELMKSMIAAGAAGVHFEDQLSSRKCGGMGGKVLLPTREVCDILVAARLAADVLDVPTVLIARTDAAVADYLTTDADPEDRRFLTGRRSAEGLFELKDPQERALARGVAFARYADMVWCETGAPDLAFARRFAQAVHAEHPRKLLAYNCTAGFDWNRHFSEREIAGFQDALAELGYRYQFITLAGYHSLNVGMFDLAHGYARERMTAYARLQEVEARAARNGFTGLQHHREVGAGYFDEVAHAIQTRHRAHGAPDTGAPDVP